MRNDEIGLDISPPRLVRRRGDRAIANEGDLIDEFDRLVPKVDDADIVEFLRGQMADDVLSFLPLIDRDRVGQAFDVPAPRIEEKEDIALAPMIDAILKPGGEFGGEFGQPAPDLHVVDAGGAVGREVAAHESGAGERGFWCIGQITKQLCNFIKLINKKLIKRLKEK